LPLTTGMGLPRSILIPVHRRCCFVVVIVVIIIIIIIMAIDAKKLERIQWKFVALCQKIFFTHDCVTRIFLNL
jgi:hypothetical protein